MVICGPVLGFRISSTVHGLVLALVACDVGPTPCLGLHAGNHSGVFLVTARPVARSWLELVAEGIDGASSSDTAFGADADIFFCLFLSPESPS